MRADLQRQVRQRAGGRCEYCRLPESPANYRFPIDHVVARQHRGPTESDNLALSCPHCNLHKGPNLTGIDPDTGAVVPLFNPRRDRWVEHFAWRAAGLIGLTPIGRTTIEVLAMNDVPSLRWRQALIDEGFFPPRAE